jgi:hypothetical protein
MVEGCRSGSGIFFGGDVELALWGNGDSVCRAHIYISLKDLHEIRAQVMHRSDAVNHTRAESSWIRAV